MITASLDYIPLLFTQFIAHFLNIFTFKQPENEIIGIPKYTRISGYSCRSLFDTTLKFYTDKNPNLKILTTPLHHTSFRNIIEKYVKKKIYIF